MVEPAALHDARCATGRATARGAPTPTRWPRIYRRYREGLERAGLVDAELFAWRALDALAAEPAALGHDPGVRLRVRRLHAARARRARDARRARCGADVTVSLPLRARARGVQGRGRRARAAGGAWPPSGIDLEPVADHYADARPRRAPRAGARAVRADPPGRWTPGDAVRLHAAGGRARRAGAGRGARCSSCCARAPRPATWRWCCATRPLRIAGGAGLRRLRDPVLDRPLAAAGAHRPRPRAARAASLRRPRGRPPRTCWPTCARPALLQQPALADRLEAEVRRPGAHAPARASSGSASAGRLDELDRLAGAAHHRAATCTSSSALLERLFAAPYQRTRRRARRRPSSTTPRALRAGRTALAELRALVEHDERPRLDRRRVARHPGRAAGARGREPAARPRAGGRARGDPRAALRGRVRAAGCRRASSPAARARALPARRRPPRASPRRAGCVLPLREDRLDRERYLFYVCASRAERLLVLSSRYCDEEGNPRSPSFFVDDVRDAVRRRCPRSAPLAGRRDLDARRGADRRRVGARAGARRAAPPRSAVPARSPRAPLLARAGRARRGVGRRPRALRRLPGEVAGGGRAAAPRRSSPTPSRWCAAPTRTPCSSAPTPRCARRPAAAA